MGTSTTTRRTSAALHANLPITPVGAPEIAHILDRERRTVETWIYRGTLIRPEWKVHRADTWELNDIMLWAEMSGRWTPAAQERAKEHANNPMTTYG